MYITDKIKDENPEADFKEISRIAMNRSYKFANKTYNSFALDRFKESASQHYLI
ncbi:hypothetical protein RhiirA4_485954 [Rhizophagus irregularis]|uniref:Uncharacterized protein n=1 Tax=Rhizophagus irregularis TaxID=588596 RepID=A0A2I1HQT6_9GLOM|nr:hypothetical protein RhiirA4_485954 [Rhizophagus irregularis]